MPQDRLARRDRIFAAGLTLQGIAKDVQVHPSLVSLVIAGHRFEGAKARQVMHYIAGFMELPPLDLFPELERRRKPRVPA